MRKKVMAVAVAALMIAYTLTAPWHAANAATGFGAAAQAGETVNTVVSEASFKKLHVEGTGLADSDGKPVQLRGVSTHGLAWFPQYVNKKLFKELEKKWGANVVRLAMYTAEYGGYCSGGNKKELRALVKKGVKYASQVGLYAIVDWHILNDNSPVINQKEAVKFFRTMSKSLAKYDNVIYEICNEPNGGTSWAEIKKYALKVIKVIRKNDPDAVIVVGTPNWSQLVLDAAADPIKKYDNVCYTFHFYAATHKDSMRTYVETALKKGLPIFVTEFGISEASGDGNLDYDSADEWIKLFDKYGVSYVCWNLANKAEASSLFKAGCSKTSGFTNSDLSDQGLWLFKLLSKKAGKKGTLGTGGTGGKDTGDKQDTGDKTTAGGTEAPDTQGNGTETPKGSGNTGDQGAGQGTGNTPYSSYDLEGTSGKLQYYAQCTGSWEEGGKTCLQYTMTVKNTGSSMKSWKIRVKFKNKIKLVNSWNGEFREGNKELIITNADYNGALSKGAEAGDIGFIVSFS